MEDTLNDILAILSNTFKTVKLFRDIREKPIDVKMNKKELAQFMDKNKVVFKGIIINDGKFTKIVLIRNLFSRLKELEEVKKEIGLDDVFHNKIKEMIVEEYFKRSPNFAVDLK